jgi:hypothetical protein
MTFVRTFLSLLAASCLFAFCAASYRPISPSSLQFPQSTTSNNFAYKYDVLIQANNRKLAKKEMQSPIKVVAVKIVNNTSQTLKYGVNYKIYAGDREGNILAADAVTSQIKETVPTYLLYLLLTPTKLTVSTATSSNSYPIGLILGPTLTAINVGVSATANKHFRMELEEYSLQDKEIKPGETVYGLIGIESSGFAPLTLKITSN